MHHFKQKRIISSDFLSNYNVSVLKIGIPVLNSENGKLGLNDAGDSVVPNSSFGINCRKNANGYSYADKTAPKEKRYTHTTYFLPFGNINASEVYVDHYRDCYPQINVSPLNIALTLFENNKGEKYIFADSPDLQQHDVIMLAINMFLEIFGECYCYDDAQQINKKAPRRFFNWEFLPQGCKPSDYVRGMLAQTEPSKKHFIIDRLEKIESFNPEFAGVGTNGLTGYYAYKFNEICVFECSLYGNATYIVPSMTWEELSKKTKQELTIGSYVIERIIHDTNWFSKIEEVFLNHNIV